MSARTRLLAVATVLVLVLPGSAFAAEPVMTGYETRVTTDPGDQYDPAIDGNLVVFTDYRSADTDVYYVDLNDMSEHPVIVAPGNQELTGVSAGIIVYTDYRTSDVIAFKVADGTTQNLTHADKDAVGHNFNSIDPAVSLGLVAWEDSRDGNMEIYAKDLATGVERRITNSLDVDSKPSVSGTIIVWQRCAAGGTCDVWAYDWATSTTTQITNLPASNERSPNIDGKKIVYQSDRSGDSDVYLYDLDTGIETALVLPGDQANPHVSGDFVAMDDLSGGLYHIKLWHPASGKSFDVTSGTSGQYLNDIDGNRVVYTDDRNGDLEIYMYTFTVDFPSTEVCRAASLTATRTYTGDGDEHHDHDRCGHGGHSADGYQVLAPAMRFAVPGALPVVAGKPGNKKATFTYGLGAHETFCHYTGNGVDKYLFSFCSDGSTAGKVVQADRAWLHLDDGDRTAGETKVVLDLAEASPCVGALPPDCDHLDGAAPIVDATFDRQAHSWHHDFSLPFLANPMDGLVCVDNGPDGKPSVLSGTVRLNETGIVALNGWAPRIEGHARLGAFNYLRATIKTPDHGAMRVRVFAGAPAAPAHKGHHYGWGHGHGLYEGSGDEAPVGCSQSGPGLVPLALFALLLYAFLPRRALSRTRSRHL